MTLQLTATSDLDGGLILEASGVTGGREYAFYKTSVLAGNIIALTNKPRYVYPDATTGTYWVVVKDKDGNSLGSASASGTVSGDRTFYTDDTDIEVPPYDNTNLTSAELILPRIAMINRAKIIDRVVSGAYTLRLGNAVVSTSSAEGVYSPKATISRITSIEELDASPYVRDARVPFHTLFYAPYRFTSTETDYQKPFIAYVKNGRGKGWITDALAYYAFWANASTLNIFTGGAYGDAKSMTDTKLAMDAAHTFIIPKILKTIPESLVILDTAIAELKDDYPELDQSFVMKVLMLWARAPQLNGSTVTQWGSLSLAEIQALNAQGASISEALAGVTLLWNNSDHVSAVQKYWWFKIQGWFTGLTNVTLSGFEKLDDATGRVEIGEIFSPSFKSWFDANVADGFLSSHGWTENSYGESFLAVDKPADDNSTIFFKPPSFTFADHGVQQHDARKAVMVNDYIRSGVVRGHQLELPEMNQLVTPSIDELGYCVSNILSALENVAAFSAPLFTYFSNTILLLLADERTYYLYDYMCECILGLPHTAELTTNFTTISLIGSGQYRTAVSGLDEYTEKIKIDFNNNVNNATSLVDSISLGGQLIDINLRLEAPSGFLLSYDANGGDGSMDSETAFTATVRANGFNRTGYTFTGWNTAFDGSGTAYQPADTITLTEDVVLYAQWVEFSIVPPALFGAGL